MRFFLDISDILAEKNISFTGTTESRPVSALLPDERKIISKAILKRQEEFATGRWCARKSLEKLGGPVRLIMTGKKGEPVWPEGICGSIAHTSGAYCSALALLAEYRSIGIDIESSQRKIKEEVLWIILNDDESAWLSGTGKQREQYKKLIFCAKESIFKLFYPVVKRHFSFAAVSILPPAENGAFSYILNTDLAKDFSAGWKGRGYYFTNNKWLLTLSYLKEDRDNKK